MRLLQLISLGKKELDQIERVLNGLLFWIPLYKIQGYA